MIDTMNGKISLQLRTERAEGGSDCIDTISITGTDGSENSSDANVTVFVPYNKQKN